MIYKSLRKLPMITCVEIIDTGNISLLSDDEDTPIHELIEVWEPLLEEYKEKYGSKDNKKVFNLYKEIEYLNKKHFVIKSAVEALRFDKNQGLINMLLEFGYKLRFENYNEDLERIERESAGIILKIKMFQDQLPKEPVDSKNTNDAASSIVNIMAGYSSILGYDFDFYTISVEKFYSLEKQVKNKISIIEKQNAKYK